MHSQQREFLASRTQLPRWPAAAHPHAPRPALIRVTIGGKPSEHPPAWLRIKGKDSRSIWRILIINGSAGTSVGLRWSTRSSPHDQSAHRRVGYYCLLGDMMEAKRRPSMACEMDKQWKAAALDDSDLKVIWDDIEAIE